MGAKQSSLSDSVSADTIHDHTFGQFTNGTGHSSRQLKKKKALKKQSSIHFVTSNNSTPSLRDRIDRPKMGVSFDTSDSSEMPDADELERRFHKGLQN